MNQYHSFRGGSKPIMNESINKPDTTEYLPYYGKYVSLVPDGDIVTVLGQQMEKPLAS